MTGKQLQKAIFGGLGVLLGFVWLGCFAVIFLGGNTGFVQGIPGFAQEAAWRVAVAAALAAAVFSGGRVLLAGEYAWEMKAAFLAAGAICILLAFFLLREPVMDISYLDSPRETRLEQVSFGSSQLGDGSVRYYLEGRGTEGDHLFFRLSRGEYDEGCGLRQENPDMSARVVYLPHTDVVMTVEFLSEAE